MSQETINNIMAVLPLAMILGSVFTLLFVLLNEVVNKHDK